MNEDNYRNRLKYYKIYNNLIDKGLKRELNRSISSDVYYEKHHILPKCIGGNNVKIILCY